MMLLALLTVVRSDWSSMDGEPDDHDALRAQMNQVSPWPTCTFRNQPKHIAQRHERNTPIV